MRWHFVGAIISTLISILYLGTGLLLLGMMIYYHILYGPIAFSNGEYEAMDLVALTWKNILRVSCTLLVGIGLSASAICWFKKINRIGLLVFVLSLAFSGVTAAIIRNL